MFRKKKQPQNNRNSPNSRQPTAVFSYYSNRSDSETSTRLSGSSSNVAHTSRLQLLPSYIAILIILGSCIYATTLTTQPKIQVNSQTNKQLLRNNDFYQQASAKILNESLFNFSKLTIDTAKVATKIETTYPELGDVTIVIPLVGRRPIVEVRPAQATLQLVSNNGSFIIDERGRALMLASEANSSVRDKLVVIRDESGLEIKTSKQVIPDKTIKFINEVNAQLAAKQIKAPNLTLPAIANELHLRLDGRLFYAKFDIQGDPRLQVGNMLAAISKLDSDKTLPVEYLDVRVSEKVFYK